MINNLGQWEENKDYNTYPKEKWCDMDYMATWIRSKGYEIKTNMENLILIILAHYEDSEEYKENGFFAIMDTRKYPNNLMINIPDVESYVLANGGIKEFDYEI
ncbi:MAG: hypothetical protein NC347_00365 [Clostridium sp.]|nr:hypothetical protein [Clostridium sp.]